MAKNKTNNALISFSKTLADLIESYSDGKLNYAEMIGALQVAQLNIYQELLLITMNGDNDGE